FDKGTLRDGEGRDIDFKNTVIIMTSNAGTDEIKKLCADPDTRPDPDALAEALHPVLVKTFRPAFLGRVTLLPYYPLTDDVMRSIVERQLELVGRRVRENHRASFDWDSQVVESIVGRCKEVDTGARNVHHILNRTLLPELSTEFLARLADGRPIASVRVGLGGPSGFSYKIEEGGRARRARPGRRTLQGRGLPSFGGSRRRLEARSSRRRGPNRRRGPRSRKKAAT